MPQIALEHDTHVARAQQHFDAGVALHQASEGEWAAVCYFYAAYHLVKAAMLADPIFDSAVRCSTKNPNLAMGDRYTERHKARRSGDRAREWGVNDLVLVLYRDIAGDYERLHQASISVRYRDGLPAGALDALYSRIDAIRSAFSDGLLVAS